MERLELSNSSEELKEFLDETDSSLKEALSNEETCSEVLYQLRQKVEQYPEHVGMSEQKSNGEISVLVGFGKVFLMGDNLRFYCTHIMHIRV